MDNRIITAIEQAFSSIKHDDQRAKIPPLNFVLALICCLASDSRKRSIAALRRSIISLVGLKIARSTFWQRLAAKQLPRILCSVLVKLIGQLSEISIASPTLLKKLKVKGIYLLDASIITLNNKASMKHFPAATKNGPGGIKWHLCLNLLTAIPQWFTLTDALRNERNEVPPLKMLKGALVLFDLGYFKYDFFRQLHESKCFYLSRVFPRAWIEITGTAVKLPPSKKDGGKKGHLFSYNWSKCQASIVDLIGTITIDKTRNEYFHTRVIGFWNSQRECYHWYITNLPVAAKLIYPLYRMRWQVELSFKAAKSHLALADITSGNQYAIRSLFLVSVIAYLISQPLMRNEPKTSRVDKKAAISIQLVAAVFVHISNSLFRYLISKTSKNLVKLQQALSLYSKEVVDPNWRHRPSTLRELMAV